MDRSLVCDNKSVPIEDALEIVIGYAAMIDMRVAVDTKGDVPLHEGQLVSGTTEKKIDPKEHWHRVLVYVPYISLGLLTDLRAFVSLNIVQRLHALGNSRISNAWSCHTARCLFHHVRGRKQSIVQYWWKFRHQIYLDIGYRS